MREYEPIWERLKREKVVQVTANRRLHPRIIKAVGKEKWKDLGYKIILSPKIAILSNTVKFSVLTFRLEEKIPPTEIWRYL